ncbi:MAG: N-acetylmuramoyl-L-alanine amidase, partial [Bacteroidota bacterium]
ILVALLVLRPWGRLEARTPTPRPGIIVTGISWGGDRLVIRSTSPLNPRMLTLAQPDRVVIDLLEAELADASLAQTLRVGRGGIQQIRIAQHPTGYLRLVFDCTQPTVLLLNQPKHENLLVVQSGDPDFWAAAPTPAPKPSPTPRIAPLSPLALVRPISRPSASPRPSLLSLLSATPAIPATPAPSPRIAPTPAPKASPRPTFSPPPAIPTPIPIAFHPTPEAPTPAPERAIHGIHFEHRAGKTTLVLKGEKTFPYAVTQLFAPPRFQIRVPRATFDGALPEPKGEATHLSYRREGGDLLVEVGLPDPFFRSDEEQKGDRLLVSWKPHKTKPSGLVVIDPGHGGTDPGAIGQRSTKESAVNLEMALKLQAELKKYGISTAMTRDTDVFVDLPTRPNFGEQKGAKLFVSLHCNACPNPEATGVETYYRQNDGIPLAKEIHRLLVEDLGRPDRGVKQARLYVLRSLNFPSVLVETAFISNVNEEALLADADFQQRAVQAIAGGIYRALTNPSLETLTSRVDASKSLDP